MKKQSSFVMNPFFRKLSVRLLVCLYLYFFAAFISSRFLLCQNMDSVIEEKLCSTRTYEMTRTIKRLNDRSHIFSKQKLAHLYSPHKKWNLLSILFLSYRLDLPTLKQWMRIKARSHWMNFLAWVWSWKKKSKATIFKISGQAYTCIYQVITLQSSCKQ